MNRRRRPLALLLPLTWLPLAVPASAKLAPVPGPGLLPAARGTIEVHAPAGRSDWHRGVVRGGELSPSMTDAGVLFRYRDDEARHVSVVGPFNGWDPEADPLERTRRGIWRRAIALADGEWAYLYVVDGEWLRDPDNPVLHVPESADPDEPGESSLVRIRNGEVIQPKPAGFREGTVGFGGSYDRVDQVTLRTVLSYENRAEMHPEISIGGARSFGRDRWLYDISVVQPLLDARMLDVGVTAYRSSATPDEHRMGGTENSLATFFFREDWRDYHEAEGLAAHATLRPLDGLELTARWKGEDHRSVSKTTDWGLFGGEKRMRVNPAVDEGELRLFAFGGEVDTRNSAVNPTRGFLARADWERAGGALGGDFEFRRGTADFRRYLKLSRGHFLDFRVAAGRIDGARRGGDSGELTGFAAVPVQERFYLGGTGTLRATQFKSLSGDRMLLANAEMRVEIFPDFQAVAFVDVGDAWVDDAEDTDLHTDAGIGFQDSDSSFRVNVARKVDGRDDDDGVFVSARIQRMF